MINRKLGASTRSLLVKIRKGWDTVYKTKTSDERLQPFWRGLVWIILLVAFLCVTLYALLNPDTVFGDTGASWFTEDIKEQAYWLSRCVEGEGAHLFKGQRDEVADWIAHTFVNRSENKWLGRNSIKWDVQANCHGYALVENPSWWAYEAAIEALIRSGDVTGGALFFLSGDDLNAMGLEDIETVRSFRQGRWSLHFFDEWPDD
jgi:hypothetical protein